MINVERTILGFRGSILTLFSAAIQERTPLSSPSIKVNPTPTGYFLSARGGAGDAFPQLAFWYSALSGTSVTISQGHLVVHRGTSYLASAATVTLSGTGNVYVYATASKSDLSDFAISATSLDSFPASTANQWAWPLHMFTSTDGVTYTWVTNILAGRAMELGAPI